MMVVRSRSAHQARVVALVIAAILVNILLGRLVREVLNWPLFLDSVGTILVGALLGPLAGAAAGAVSNIAWSTLFGSQTALPFAITAAFIGWAAGYAVSRGAFERVGTVLLAGLLAGLGAALISAPISAYLFGGFTAVGIDYVTSLLTAAGSNILQTATIEGFLSDPADKTLSFLIAWLAWRGLRPFFLPPSQRGTRPFEALQGYSLAGAVILLAYLLCFVFLPAFGRGIFALFYLAVLISAWRGGLKPALLTTAAGVVANILFVHTLALDAGVTVEDWLRVVTFTIVSIAIAVIADRLEKSKRDLQKALYAERASQARIRAITDGVDEALMLVGPDQRILDVNQRYTELFGVPHERVIGQRLADMRTMFDQVFADPDPLYDLALTSSTDAEQEYRRIVTQTWPQPRELQLFTTPVQDAVGFLGRLFVFRDVTHEREVDRMKTEFVSLVSHELRTPLTAIKGFTEMVLEGDAGEINEEVEEFLGVVLSNTDRLVGLVNDLLDISRIESGRIQLKSEPVDLGEVVQIVVETMEQKVKEKQQSLAVSVDSAAVRVVGDRDKLVQILTNYVSNAYKYTPAGGDIRVVVQRLEDFVQVAVIDNGHGISPEDQDRLFSRFYRVDNQMSREVGGTGLGLSIVKQLVELQGGKVGVRSVLGAGSTFYFTVPLAATVPAPAIEP